MNQGSIGPRRLSQRRRAAWTLIRTSVFTVFTVVLIACVGWGSNTPWLTSWMPGGPTIKFSTLLALTAAALALLLAGASRQPQWRPRRVLLAYTAAALAILPLVMGLVILAEPFWTGDGNAGSASVASTGKRILDYLGRPSPITSLSFTLSGLALLLWRAPGALISFSLATGGFMMFAWLGLARLLFEWPVVVHTGPWGTQSLPSALALLVLAVGHFQLRPCEGLARLFAGSNHASRLARRLTPLAIILALGMGLARVWAQRYWHFTSEFGTALYSTAMLIALVLVALRGAWVVDRSERRQHQAEAARRRDLDAREAALRQLEESEERRAAGELRFQGIFNSAFNFIGLLAPDGTILEANQTALDLIGARPDQVLGRPFPETPWWAHSDVEQRRLREAINLASQGQTVRFETSHPGADGLIHYVDFTIKPVIDPAGRVTHLVPEGRDITERKRAEEKFRGLLEAAPDAMVITNQRGDIVLVNAQAERLFGHVRDKLIGQPVEKLLPERLRGRQLGNPQPFVAEPDAPMMGSGMDLWGLHRDGHEFPVEVSLSPLKTTEGVLILSAIRDVSARKAEEARRATLFDVTRILSDAQTMEEAATGILQAVCNHLPWDFGDVWRVDTEAGRLRCVALWPTDNQQFAEFEAATYAILFTPGLGLPGTIWQTARPLWIPDLSTQANFPRSRAAGRCALHASFGFPIVLAGQVCGVVEFFSDAVREPDAAMVELLSAIGVQFGHFMERQRAQEATAIGEALLRESETRFRGAFEHSAVGMALVSLEGRWLRVNQAVCEIVGRTETELLACTFQDITHPDDLNADLDHVGALIAGEDDHYTMEKRYLHKSGQIVWVLLAVTLVRNATGQPAYFISQVSDITPQREAQQRMKASLEEKEVLLREIHHRVKNNLQLVSSLLQLQSISLHDARDSAIFQECQERIHAMALVHDRLYQSGSLATIDFAAHLRELAALILRGQADATGRIRLNVESEPIEVNLDTAIPLGLIATELITNAYKHAFRGRDSGLITVRLARPAPGRIQLSVEDNGVGLPEGFQPEKARSLGLRLVRTLGGQLRAKVAVASSAAGTKMYIGLSIQDQPRPVST